MENTVHIYMNAYEYLGIYEYTNLTFPRNASIPASIASSPLLPSDEADIPG